MQSAEQDKAAGGRQRRTLTRSDGSTAHAWVRLVLKKRARRIYGFLAWSEEGRRQELFLAEATARTRTENLALMWSRVHELNLLQPEPRAGRVQERRRLWPKR